MTEQQWREWLHSQLTRAAAELGVTISGSPVYGWGLRSVGVRADHRGRSVWLRLGAERQADIEDMPEFWTGNLDANVIIGVAKPQVLASAEWAVPEQGMRARADLMTWLAGRPCSPTEMPQAPFELSAEWWQALQHTLQVLRTVPTTRFAAQRNSIAERASAQLGVPIVITEWSTRHGDLHWNNLLTDPYGVLDWEMWGVGPACTDAASLYCLTLHQPDTAAMVHEQLGDQLDTAAGRTAQLIAAARLLRRADSEPQFQDLIGPLRHLVDTLTASPAVTLK